MNPPPETDFNDDPIEELAAQWLLQRSEGFSAEQEREFTAWIDADPRHAAAFARLEQTCALLEKMPLVKTALTSETPPISRFESKVTRSRSVFRQVVLAAAAAIAVGIAAWWQWPSQPREASPPAHYATASVHPERIALDDGSVLTLNSGSEVQVRFSAHERRVVLAKGEAYFSVAHDADRPFVVEASGVAMRAVGTAFNVRIAEEAVELLVTEGKVRVVEPSAPPRSSRSAPVPSAKDDAPLVQANQRAVIRTSPAAEPVPLRVEDLEPTAIHDVLAWQDRMLVFNDTPLREVAAQFNRRNRIQLFIADDLLGDRRVGGTFASDNVESFVGLLASDGSVVMERPTEHEIVLRRAP